MKKSFSRPLSFLLVLSMLISMFSFSASAWSWNGTNYPQQAGLYTQYVSLDNEHYDDHWDASPGYSSDLLFYYYDGSNTPVLLSADDLHSTDGNVVTVEQAGPDNSITRASVKGFGSANIQYTVNGNTYSYAVNSDLPPYGYYSADNVQQADFISGEYTVKTGDTIYFISRDQAFTSVTLDPEFDAIADAVVSGDNMSVAITMTDAPSDGTMYQLYFETATSKGNPWIRLCNGNPHLVFSWIGQSETRGEITGSPGTVSPVELYFIDASGNKTSVLYSELTSDNPSVATVGSDMQPTVSVISYKGFGTANLTYTAQDGNTYAFPVTVELPTVGFYSGTSPAQNDFLREFVVTDTNNKFYLVPQSGFYLDRVTPEGPSGSLATCTIDSSGTFATVEVNGSFAADDVYRISYAYRDAYGSTRNEHASITLINGKPNLLARYPAIGPDGPLEDVNPLMSQLSVFPGTNTDVYFYYAENGVMTKLSAQELQSSDPDVFSIIDSDPLTGTVRVKCDKVGTATITYQKQDGTILSMPVVSQLPDTGYYSQPVANADNYIQKFTVTDTDNTFYFVAINGITFNEVSLEGDFADIATIQLSDDKTYATITVTGDPANRMYIVTGSHTYAGRFNWGIELVNQKTSGTIGTNLTWKIDGTVLTISGTGAMVPVPRLWYGRNITKVVVEEGVTSVGAWAFADLSTLKEVSLPSTLDTIGYQAFISTGIEEITIPDSVVNLDYEVFANCQQLKKVTLSDHISNVGYGVFADCFALEDVHLPANATRIGAHTFKNCGALTSITFPDTLETIDNEAFLGAGLTGVVVPTGVNTLGIMSLGYDGNGNPISGFHICGSPAAEQYADDFGFAKHDLKKVPEVSATYTADGTKEHWSCACGGLYLDEAGTQKVTEADLVIPQLVKVESGKAEVSESAVEEAIASAGSNEAVTLPLNEADSAVTTAEIPVASLDKVAAAEKSLTVETSEATVSLDTGALEKIAETAGTNETVTLEVKKVDSAALNGTQQAAIEKLDVKAVISAEILCGGKNISDFGNGTVTVKIPYQLGAGDTGDGLKLIYVADDGTIEEIASSYQDGFLFAVLNHFSEYAIIREAPLPADYTAVDGAIAKANALNQDEYKDFSAVEAAINAVVRGLNATEQEAVDAMAKAIEDAIAALEKKFELVHDCPGDDTCPSRDYTDVNKNAWYHSDGYVDYAIARGFMTGISTNPLAFAPNLDVTRAQMTQVLWKLEGAPTGAETAGFTDVKEGSWYADSINWAYEQGIAKGIGNNCFDPNGKLTREQMVTFLYRYAQYKGVDVTSNPIPSRFADKSKVSSFAESAMAWAVENQIISGMGTKPETIAPKAIAKRAQLAKIITVFLEANS